MTGIDACWSAFVAHFKELALLDGARALLAWDQQTYLPAEAAAERGAQLALLSGLSHARRVDPRVLEWLEALTDADLDPVRAAGVRNIRRMVLREVRVPAALVTRLATLQSEGFTAWIRAKQEDRWDLFAPVLQRLLDAAIERARAIDPAAPPYDVLLAEFDPGTTAETLRLMFARLRAGLSELLRAIAASPPLPERTVSLATARQAPLHRAVTAALGYRYEGGRMDLAEHPFSVAIGTGDVRITTHLHEDDVLGGLSGSVHEAGHAMYEQGLPRDKLGWGVEEAASMGLHESQSRFWENWIGRSRPFLRWFAARLREHAPELDHSPEELYVEANRVEAGLIRIYADEVTYNLHIVIRFELELALFEGQLTVLELPDAWRAKYREYLGVEPPTDREGVLQDVHWSGAAFGYFPSYTLGNLYAASLARAVEAAVPDLEARVEQGDFTPILSWLRENVHQHGHRWDAPELVARATGPRDAVSDLLDHLWARHGALYGVSRPAG